MKTLSQILLCILLQIASISILSRAASSPLPVPDEVSFMTFNVENLFDDRHDPLKEDYPFLPLANKKSLDVQNFCKTQKGPYKKECFKKDWNQTVIEHKLKNLSQVILGVDEKGPDVLFLVEVENQNILSQLNKKYLSKSGYSTQILIEGFDTRGIDVALLSRLPLAGAARLHKIPYKGKTTEEQKWMDRSRGILEVPLKLPDGSRLTALVVHLPSQRNPHGWRAQAVAFIQTLLSSRQNETFILGGDFNITTQENRTTGLFSKELAKVGLVSHLVGCASCRGTHYFKKEWSFLDAFVFSKSLDETGKASYQLEKDSLRVINSLSEQTGQTPVPKRFSPSTGKGVSDHFPLYARLRRKRR